MSRAEIVSICKKDLLDIYNHTIAAIRPDQLIKDSLNICNKEQILTVKGACDRNNVDRLDLKNRSIHVVGGGKCVLGMAQGLAELAIQAGISHRFSLGLLSLPTGLKKFVDSNQNKSKTLLDSIGIECLFGSKDNLPDENSVLASKSLLERIDLACADDLSRNIRPLFIVLISGGGSACLTSPKHIDLDEKLRLIQFLIQRGANIVELNKVRRYFSHIKGGQLASHILRRHPESRILTLIMSDVIGDPIEFIASGPTFIEGNHEGQQEGFQRSMLNVLNKYHFPDLDKLSTSFKLDPREESSNLSESQVINRIIGNNTTALNAAMNKAAHLGYKFKCLGNELQGFTEQVIETFLNAGDEFLIKNGNEFGKILILGGGETTVNKLPSQSWGRGGRAQEMALDYLISRMSCHRNVRSHSGADDNLDMADVFLAAGTDGQDGPTDVAGCLVSYEEMLNDCKNGKSICTLDEANKAKFEHNSHFFWTQHKPNWLIRTGLTGTNVMDLYMYGMIVNKS